MKKKLKQRKNPTIKERFLILRLSQAEFLISEISLISQHILNIGKFDSVTKENLQVIQNKTEKFLNKEII